MFLIGREEVHIALLCPVEGVVPQSAEAGRALPLCGACGVPPLGAESGPLRQSVLPPEDMDPEIYPAVQPLQLRQPCRALFACFPVVGGHLKQRVDVRLRFVKSRKAGRLMTACFGGLADFSNFLSIFIHFW